jgi:hypothetical protein
MNLEQTINAHKRIYTARINRARNMSRVFGNLTDAQCQEAAKKGMETVAAMSHEKLVSYFVDNLDLVMMGLQSTQESEGETK